MIERCRSLSTDPVALLTSDWHEVSARRYDLIVATLVLQHVETEACVAYLKDFARLAPVTYVLTRVRSDFDANVLQLIADTSASMPANALRSITIQRRTSCACSAERPSTRFARRLTAVTTRWCCARECDASRR